MTTSDAHPRHCFNQLRKHKPPINSQKNVGFPYNFPENLGFPYKNPMNMVVFPLHSHENVGFPKLFSMSFFLQCGFSHRATRGTQDLSHFDPGDPRIRDEGQGAKI